MHSQTEDVLLQGIYDELAAAQSFIKLAKKDVSADLKIEFLQYAQEELSHAIHLISSSRRLIGGSTCESACSSEALSFLIEYMAKEDAAIFYYEALEKMMDDDREKGLFHTIHEEEINHYKKLQHIIDTFREK